MGWVLLGLGALIVYLLAFGLCRAAAGPEGDQVAPMGEQGSGLAPEPLPRGEQRGVAGPEKSTPKRLFFWTGGGAAPLFFALLSLSACQTSAPVAEPPEPRLMAHGQIQPFCLAFCQIHQNLASSEGVRAGKANDIAEQFSGGSSQSTLERGQ